jgi:integrase
VRRSITGSAAAWSIEEPKTHRSQRTLPLIAAPHEQRHPSSASRCWPAPSGTTRTWSSPSPTAGRPTDKKTDHDDWTRLLQEAGVRPHDRPHDRRHTAVTLLLGENVPPRVVMELFGHSQMRTTMDIYSHVMPALAREAADPNRRRAADEQDIANCNHEDR